MYYIDMVKRHNSAVSAAQTHLMKLLYKDSTRAVI